MSEAEIEVFLLSYIKNSNIITISNILNSDRNGLTEVMHIIWQVKPKIKKKEKESSKKKKSYAGQLLLVCICCPSWRRLCPWE